MNPLYAELQWLPRTPDDFSARLKAIAAFSNDSTSTSPLGRELQSLASSFLNLNQLTKLAKLITAARAEGKSLAPLIPFRLAILSNSTIDYLVPALIATAARHGIDLEIIQPSYDQVAQEALTPNSKVNASKPDAVLFALDYRALPLKLTPGDPDSSAATAAGAIGYLQALQNGIKSNSNALCIFQTFAPPAETLFGSLDRSLPGTLRSLLDSINQSLAAFTLSSGDLLLDVANLAETIGLANWHNHQLGNMAKFSFSDELIPLYADHLSRTVAAIRGKSRKALILALDNTLWGGVIGDDGLEGIALGQGSPLGEAYTAFQDYVRELSRRGVILAVCSKNDEANALEPFEQHPDMVLKRADIASFVANWQNKADNIRAIARELNIGLDALCFIDDNPFERNLVRQELPMVAVPEVSDDPTGYPRALADGGYFEGLAVTDEDRERTSLYQGNKARDALKAAVTDLPAYLRGLEMRLIWKRFDTIGLQRIVQLINKSNQFNLTTRRYTDADVLAVMADRQAFGLQLRLTDRFGDNGIIAIVIGRLQPDRDLIIDTWLMSCRVLGRQVEPTTLNLICQEALKLGARRVVGAYVPTKKNAMVKDHYARLGFTVMETTAAGGNRNLLDLAGFVPAETFIHVTEG